MYELFVKGDTLPDAYHKSLVALHEEHEFLPCTDYGTNQKECSMTFVVEEALKEPMISRLFIGDPRALEQYRQEILYGILDFEVERGNWEYTYHDRMAAQLPWVVDELKRNPDTRRAVLSIRTPDDLASTSPACLQTIHFLIRGGKLHCKISMRSNDATKAAFMNAFAFIMLQKDIADQLGIPVGSYTHRSNSYHVYENGFPDFERYVAAIKSGRENTYEYVGYWDEMMEDAKPDIAAMVEELKGR